MDLNTIKKHKSALIVAFIAIILIISLSTLGSSYYNKQIKSINKELKTQEKSRDSLLKINNELESSYEIRINQINDSLEVKIQEYETKISQSKWRERKYRKEITDLYNTIYSRRELDSIAGN